MFDRRRIFGHVRFSYYGLTDTRLKPTEDGAALARLYDETRMARRFFLFENLTLPCLLAQTDRDFTTIILSSDVMPDRFKERLARITATLPGAVLEFSASRRGDLALRRFMAEAAGPAQDAHSVHFRLDDDDALAASYVARLRAVTQALPPATHVTFPTGIYLFPSDPADPEGTSILHQQMFLSMGLATVNGGSFHKNPFQMMHGDVWRRWPVVSIPGFAAFIRTHHLDNDTLAQQDKVIAALQRERRSRRHARHAAAVDQALAAEFPFIDRVRLDGLIGRLAAITGMDDLEPIDPVPPRKA